MATDNLPPLKRIVKFPTLESVLDFPNVGKSPKEDRSTHKKSIKYSQNNNNPCPSCGGGMDESAVYLTCVECGYRIKK